MGFIHPTITENGLKNVTLAFTDFIVNEGPQPSLWACRYKERYRLKKRGRLVCLTQTCQEFPSLPKKNNAFN